MIIAIVISAFGVLAILNYLASQVDAEMSLHDLRLRVARLRIERLANLKISTDDIEEVDEAPAPALSPTAHDVNTAVTSQSRQA